MNTIARPAQPGGQETDPRHQIYLLFIPHLRSITIVALAALHEPTTDGCSAAMFLIKCDPKPLSRKRVRRKLFRLAQAERGILLLADSAYCLAEFA